MVDTLLWCFNGTDFAGRDTCVSTLITSTSLCKLCPYPLYLLWINYCLRSRCRKYMSSYLSTNTRHIPMLSGKVCNSMQQFVTFNPLQAGAFVGIFQLFEAGIADAIASFK